jgi:hypothetical protein
LGQIGQTFDHIYDKKEITELSVVAYTDSFFCGYWSRDDMLLKADYFSGENALDLMKQLLKEFPDAALKMLSSTIPFVHVPKAQYEDAGFELYFKGLYDLRKRKRHDKQLDAFKNLDANTLYYLERTLCNEIKQEERSVETVHISTAMSNYAYLTESDCLIYLQGSSLHICCHRDGTFLFYNQFYCAGVNDYLYFILAVLQHFNIDYTSLEIQLAGEIDKSSRLYSNLKTYMPGLRLMDDLVQTREDLPSGKQLYFDLFLARTCV